MKIESEIAKASRYGEDAIEAFNTAVDNGQARLAMSILVDVINAFADKIDELEKNSTPVIEDVVKPQETVEVKKDEPKQKAQTLKEEVKPQAKEENIA